MKRIALAIVLLLAWGRPAPARGHRKKQGPRGGGAKGPGVMLK